MFGFDDTYFDLAKALRIPMLSASGGSLVCDNLKNGMPDNPIIAESIRLYRQEVKLALQ